MRFRAVILALSIIVPIATVQAGKPKPKPKVDTSIRAESIYVKDKAAISKPTESKTAYIKPPFHQTSTDPNKRKVSAKRKGEGLRQVPKEIRRRSHFTEGP